MRIHTIIILLLTLLSYGHLSAQDTTSAGYADLHSYQLYLDGKWTELLNFGNSAIKSGIDFTYLRLRMGYAAVQKKNYSEGLKQYEAVLKKDSYNETARYYLWYCRQFLNQYDAAVYHAKYLSKEIREKEDLKKFKINSAGIESSFKTTDNQSRGNSFYNRIHVSAQLGWRVSITQSVISFNQTISERKLTNVIRNNAININQKEYYNLTSINLDHQLQLRASYHYLYTPFNNIVYQNHIGMIGLKHLGDYVNLQGNILMGKLSDSSFSQFELQADCYPSGNLNFYSHTNLSLRNYGNDHRFNIKEVAGFKISNQFWVEGNVTIGKFSNRAENEGLYIYNSIDPNLMKAGINCYYSPSDDFLLQFGFTSEKRELVFTNFIFNQLSINGGIKWKF